MNSPLSAVVSAVAITAVSTDESVALVAAGPLTKQPNTKPYRTVLLEWENKYSVHEEVFHLDDWSPDLPLEEQLMGTPSSFNHGDYFTIDHFVEATIEFARRIQAHAKQHVGSIYRQINQPV